MTSTSPGTVLVGVDGSHSAELAIDWAADEAALHGWRLELVHAHSIAEPYGDGVPIGSPAGTLPAFLTEAKEHIVARHPGLQVDLDVVVGKPSRVLIDRSEDAVMTVVGARGHSFAARLAIGSVGRHVSAHAENVSVVVRGSSAGPDGPVVAGIDDSEHAIEVLRMAGHEAELRRVRLVVFHAWDVPVADPYGAWYVADDIPDVIEREAHHLVIDAVARLQAELPHLDTEIVVRRGHPVPISLAMSERAQLLVLGRHGGGWFEGMVSGSVAAAARHDAACPVMIVPVT
jgi:nucleotide-binding universal stress UspA family protein